MNLARILKTKSDIKNLTLFLFIIFKYPKRLKESHHYGKLRLSSFWWN